MTLVPVQTLLDQARDRADMINSKFVTDSEALKYLNLAYQSMYDIITTNNEDFFISSSTIQLVDQQSDYNLPGDFYKVRGVDLLSGLNNFTLRPFSFNERNRYRYGSALTTAGPVYRYHVLNSVIRFIPLPGTGQITLWYIPTPQLAISVDEQFETLGFDEYLITYIAMKMLMKEESDTADVKQELAVMTERVRSMTKARDSGFPTTVQDVDVLNDNLLFPGLWI